MAKEKLVKMVARHTVQTQNELGETIFIPPGGELEFDADEAKRMFLRGAASYHNDQETQAIAEAAVDLPPETEEQKAEREAAEKKEAERLEAEKKAAAAEKAKKSAGSGKSK